MKRTTPRRPSGSQPGVPRSQNDASERASARRGRATGLRPARAKRDTIVNIFRGEPCALAGDIVACSSLTRRDVDARNVAATLAAQQDGMTRGDDMRLLMIEDEKELAVALQAALSKQGVVVDHTMRLADALELTLQNAYDAILLDRRLPDGEGLTFIPKLRRAGVETPVIVLTARNEPTERIKGLDGGADDYLGKPFLVDELMARLRAVLRRPGTLVEPKITAGRLVIDPLNLSVTCDSAPFELPRRELLVLVALAKRKDRTVLRAALETAVYNYEEEIQSNALDAHISRLRKRLTDAGAGVTVHNIRGVGYLMKEE